MIISRSDRYGMFIMSDSNYSSALALLAQTVLILNRNRKPLVMFLRVENLLKQCTAAVLCITAISSFAESGQSPSMNANLTPVPVRHSVECPAPKRELCAIRKPVGAGYRTLTQGINLEDAGEYWIADFTKLKLADSAKLQFRVMGKDNDVHEIEVSFQTTSAAKEKPVAKKVKTPLNKKTAKGNAD